MRSVGARDLVVVVARVDAEPVMAKIWIEESEGIAAARISIPDYCWLITGSRLCDALDT